MSLPSLSASRGSSRLPHSAFKCIFAHHRACLQVSEQPRKRGELWLHRAPSGKGAAVQDAARVNRYTAGQRADASCPAQAVGTQRCCLTASAGVSSFPAAACGCSPRLSGGACCPGLLQRLQEWHDHRDGRRALQSRGCAARARVARRGESSDWQAPGMPPCASLLQAAVCIAGRMRSVQLACPPSHPPRSPCPAAHRRVPAREARQGRRLCAQQAEELHHKQHGGRHVGPSHRTGCLRCGFSPWLPWLARQRQGLQPASATATPLTSGTPPGPAGGEDLARGRDGGPGQRGEEGHPVHLRRGR